jgi:hypothetical protein
MNGHDVPVVPPFDSRRRMPLHLDYRPGHAPELRDLQRRFTLRDVRSLERGIEGVDDCLIPGRFGGDCTLGHVQGPDAANPATSSSVTTATTATAVRLTAWMRLLATAADV